MNSWYFCRFDWPRGAMGDFFAELSRRDIYRVGAAYVVVSWAITQVFDSLLEVFALLVWTGQPVLTVLAIGFPPLSLPPG